MKKSVLSILAVVTLVSCNTTPKLREDIKEFISQFSLEAAVSEYVSGGYSSTTTTTIGDTITTETVVMDYSLVNSDHPTYLETTTKNGATTNTVEFVENEEGCFLSVNGVLEPSSINECKQLITNFFYTEIEYGTYHAYGYYYGDFVSDSAPWVQKYVTIDQDNQLYIFEYSVTFKDDDGVDTTQTQKYSVNRFGMLVENHVLTENINKAVKKDIIVHN